MKLCFIMYQGNMYSGGQGVYLHYMTRELVRAGHEVHVISGRPYPRLAEGVIHHRLHTYSFWAFLNGRDEHAYDHSHNPAEFFHPWNFYEFASTRASLASLFFTFSVRAYQKLAELEAETGPFDLVHDNQTLGYGILAMKRLMGKPVVASLHHPLAIDKLNNIREAKNIVGRIQKEIWFPWRMQSYVANRIDMILTGSRNSARSVSSSMDIPLEHIRQTPYGVDHEVMRPIPGVKREPGTILFVGDSEDRNKGARFLIEACARLQHEMDFRLLFKDKKEQDMKVVPPLVWKYGLKRFVEYIPRLSVDELLRLYNSAQVVVSPSLYEGFGLPAAEAMACGTAVVATTAGAFPEFIEDGRTGILVPPGDPDALAAAIKSLLSDPARCERMGAAASEHIRTNFTWQRTAKVTLELYDEVLDRARSSAAMR
ncbi:MAG: glycosyltransferase family 1 protein [Dehalococcoidia bacterium]|nr:MAG: glycosyltransferase family 1 protein [Dehalococcoidia bacterium]